MTQFNSDDEEDFGPAEEVVACACCGDPDPYYIDGKCCHCEQNYQMSIADSLRSLKLECGSTVKFLPMGEFKQLRGVGDKFVEVDPGTNGGTAFIQEGKTTFVPDKSGNE